MWNQNIMPQEMFKKNKKMTASHFVNQVEFFH